MSNMQSVTVDDHQASKVRDHIHEGQELSHRIGSESSGSLSSWIQKAASLLLMLDAKVGKPGGEGVLSRTYWELAGRLSAWNQFKGEGFDRREKLEEYFLQCYAGFQVIRDCIDVSPNSLIVEIDSKVNPYFPTSDLQVERHQVFVLMPFKEPWSDRIWHSHLKPLVEGLEVDPAARCLRADDLYGHDVLLDIHRMIETSQVVIADITSRNPNVFYELGLAHAIGKKVILMTQEVNDIPFDLLRFRHILYEDNSDGYDRLRNGLEGALLEALA